MRVLSEESKLVFKYSRWLKPASVSTMLPEWVWNLLPTGSEYQARIIKSAALLGTQLGHEVKLGQVSYVQHGAWIAAFTIKSVRAAAAFETFATECCMAARASILRTAIMVGFRLPRIELGVMSCTRTEKLSDKEIWQLTTEAKKLFPEEF